MPKQGEKQIKQPTQQQTKQPIEIEPDLIRKNSYILENLNLMYETIHKETELLKNLKEDKEIIKPLENKKEEPPIFEKNKDKPEKKKVLNKTLLPTLKKKADLKPAVPRWR